MLGSTLMKLVGDHTWAVSATLPENGELKFNPSYENWNINFGHQVNGAQVNISVPDGAGRYHIVFNDQTLEYSLTKQYSPSQNTHHDKVTDSVSLAGSHNGWAPGVHHMLHVDDYTWVTTVELAANSEFKFTPFHNWSQSFGKHGGGENIAVTEGAGRYRITFYDYNNFYEVPEDEVNLKYRVEKLD